MTTNNNCVLLSYWVINLMSLLETMETFTRITGERRIIHLLF